MGHSKTLLYLWYAFQGQEDFNKESNRGKRVGNNLISYFNFPTVGKKESISL